MSNNSKYQSVLIKANIHACWSDQNKCYVAIFDGNFGNKVDIKAEGITPEKAIECLIYKMNHGFAQIKIYDESETKEYKWL